MLNLPLVNYFQFYPNILKCWTCPRHFNQLKKQLSDGLMPCYFVDELTHCNILWILWILWIFYPKLICEMLLGPLAPYWFCQNCFKEENSSSTWWESSINKFPKLATKFQKSHILSGGWAYKPTPLYFVTFWQKFYKTFGLTYPFWFCQYWNK